MCGVFGFLGLNGAVDPQASDLVQKAIQMLCHRGPDDAGMEHKEPVCLGQTRLSIIDLAGGHQPMWSADQRGLIVYNGEIYNHQEIRNELELLGRQFKTRSDTEVVLAAFLEWGPSCLARLRGMFAFAAVDFVERRALLAVDRLGKKPLYFTNRNNQLVFSSELEPLYQTFKDFRVDMKALDNYLAWQYIPAPRTIYQKISALPPAHCLIVDLKNGQVHQKQYWSLKFTEDRSLSFEEWETLLDEKLEEAVRIRLMSDVPFGAFLSGGIDSSLVTFYMSKILDEPVKTFTIGFEEADFSELKYAEIVAQTNHTDHHTEIVQADSMGLLPILVRHFGQPFADSSAIPTFYVSRMARKHVKMVLSGDGGDENFAGYHSYESVLRGLRRPNLSSTNHGRSALRLGRYFLRKFWRWIRLTNLIDEAYKLHCGTAWHFSVEQRRELFNSRYQSVVEGIDKNRRKFMDIENAPIVSRLQHLDLMAYLPFDILTKVDRTSMANSLEVRVPFLDHILVETAARMPSDLKLKQIKTSEGITYDKKFILKQLALRRYPKDLVERRKMGFGIPLNVWFATKLREEVRHRLLDSEYLPQFLRRESIRKWLDLHSMEQDHSAKIWNLLVLDEWIRTHTDAM